jgi:chemotaxis response regulator CheB
VSPKDSQRNQSHKYIIASKVFREAPRGKTTLTKADDPPGQRSELVAAAWLAIVGVGASYGGLEPFAELLENLRLKPSGEELESPESPNEE